MKLNIERAIKYCEKNNILFYEDYMNNNIFYTMEIEGNFSLVCGLYYDTDVWISYADENIPYTSIDSSFDIDIIIDLYKNGILQYGEKEII